MRLQRRHQPQLVLGARAGEDVGVLHRGGEPGIIELVEGGTGEHVVRVDEADLAGDGAGGAGVVARDHLHADPSLPALGHRGERLGTRRIDEADEAEQDQPALDVGMDEVRSARRGGALGEGEDALTPGGEGVASSRQNVVSSGASLPSGARCPAHIARMRSGAPLTATYPCPSRS